MNKLIVIPLLVSFFVTLFLMPGWVKKMKRIGLIWPDMNKFSSRRNVSGSGGIIVVLGFIIGAFVYIALRVFTLENSSDVLVQALALISVVSILVTLGFVDDLFGWRKGGLSKRSRIILVAIAAVPLMAINAGKSTMGIPFVGSVDLGLIYPLILIPIGIVGATTTYNFLAGFNGLEAGQGITLLAALAIVSVITGNLWLSIIALCMAASLLAFLIYNFDPAVVFPGDSLTYPIGGLVAIMAILGNFEKIAVFFFIPYILEFILKSRGKLAKQSFGKPNKNGSLSLRYDSLYSLNHVAIWLMQKWKIRPTEKKVVLLVWAFQILVIVVGFAIFWGGLTANV